jgi:hypothetical protein
MRYTDIRYLKLIFLMSCAFVAEAQTTFTTNNFSLLNTQTVKTSGIVYTANENNLVTAQPVRLEAYANKWVINYGIPVQASMDYAYLRSRMIVAFEMRPHIYHNGTAALRQAVDILELSPFTRISSWAPVRTELSYRYVPAILGPASSVSLYSGFNPQLQPIKGSNFFNIRQ